jgi:hypothetical protein
VESSGAWGDRKKQATRPPTVLMGVAGLLIFAVFAVGYVLLGDDEENERAPSAVNRESDPNTLDYDLDTADIADVIPKDGIPAIDDPVFEDPSDVEWIAPTEPVIAFELNGDARAYPLAIMTWHEIVNDTVGGTPVVITFCPLCNTAVAYERPVIEGEVTTFGVSGKLIHSNLLMYDRASGSLWPQATGEALVGSQRGRDLKRSPAQIVSWEDFQTAFPDGDVMSRDTGHERDYGLNPYPGYDDIGEAPFLFKGEVDGRLAAVERVLGVEAAGAFTAFPYFRLRDQSVANVAAVNASVGGEAVAVFWKKGTNSALGNPDIAAGKDVGSAAGFSRRVGGRTLTFAARAGAIEDIQTESKWSLFGRALSGRLKGQRLEPLDAIDSFWFDWAAFHPDTEIWSGT